MTRLELQTIITTNMGDTRTDTGTQVRNAIDFVGREIARQINWEGALKDGFIRTKSGRMQYPLEPNVKAVLPKSWRIAEDNRRIESIDYSSFVRNFPDKKNNTGSPFIVALEENLPIKANPASKLRIVSSDAADITQKVTVWGESYGRWLTEAISMNSTAGTTGVLSANEYTWVSTLALDAVCVGTVTITSNSTAGNTTYPTAVAAGNHTVMSIAIGDLTGTVASRSTGSLIRISMDAETAGDRSKTVRIAGFKTTASGAGQDRVPAMETMTTHASLSTTEVASMTLFTEVSQVTKGWDSTDNLIVKADPNASIVAVIPPFMRSVNYPQVQFYNIPDGKTIQYAYKPAFLGLKHDGDEPPFPEPYHELLAIWGQRIVEGWHNDPKGVINLSADPRFMTDMRAIGSDQQREELSMTMGGNWKAMGRISLYQRPITK